MAATLRCSTSWVLAGCTHSHSPIHCSRPTACACACALPACLPACPPAHCRPACLPAEEELLKDEAGALSAELLEVKEARRVLHAVRGEAAPAIQAVRWVGGWQGGGGGGVG